MKMRAWLRALLIALLLTPLVADAAPVIAVIADFIADFIAEYYVAIIAVVGATVYGSAQQRKAEDAAKDAYNAGLQDRTATVIASDSPYRYIYGRARVGSDIVAVFTSGDKDQYKYLVCVHAAHECDGIEEIYINGEALGPLGPDGGVTTGRFATENSTTTTLVTETHTGPVLTLNQTPMLDSNGLTTVRVYTGTAPSLTPLATESVVGQVVTVSVLTQVTVTYYVNSGGGLPAVYAEIHLGTATDTASAMLMNDLAPGLWPPTSVLRGFCYTVIQLNLGEQSFQTGIPTVQVLVRGKKLYDPRTGTTAWSENPALAIYDYLTSPFCQVPAADLPVAQFITAANVCDDTTVLPDGCYKFDGTITSDQNQAQTLTAMAQAMAGGIVSTTWNIYAGKYVAPVAELSQSDIVGTFSISPGISGAVVYNGTKGQYVDAANDYVATDYPQYQNAEYRSVDGLDFFANIDYPFTNTLQRVNNLSRIFVEDQRNAFTIKAEFGLKAWALQIGQRITFDSAFIGQVAKIYRITDKAYSPTSAILLTLKEDDPSIWDFTDATTPSIGPTTNLPDPWLIQPLTAIACESDGSTMLTQADGSIVARILVTWPEVTQQSVFANGQIEIDWCPVGETTWNVVKLSGDATSVYLSPVEAGVNYNIRGRCSDLYLNATSDWTFAYAAGASTVPVMDAVTGLELVGQGPNTVFQGQDAKFDWRANSTTNSFEVGSEPIGNAGSTGPQFKDYEIRIYSVAAAPVLLRTDHTTNISYTYTYEMNFSDTQGSPNRTFTIEVFQRGTLGQLSPIPASLTVSNPAPAAPTGLYATPGPSSVSIGATLPNITDYAGMIIWASTVQSFTPSAANQVYIGTGNAFNYTGLTPYIPVYIYVAFYDTFGAVISGLNLSSEVTAIPTASGILVVNTLPPTGLFIGECVYLSTDQTIYRWNGTAWTCAVTAAQITGQLAASQIAALAASQITGQLTAGQIASITASQLTGQITATQIGPNSISTAMLQAGAVSTANLAAGAVTTGNLAAGAVTATTIAAGAIQTANLAAGAVSALNISAGAVTAGALAANSVSSAVIQGGAVTANTLAAGAVTSVSLATGAVQASNIAAGAVTANALTTTSAVITGSAQIGNATVSTLSIAGNAVTIPAGATASGSGASVVVVLTQTGDIQVLGFINFFNGTGSGQSVGLTPTCNGAAGGTVGSSVSNGITGNMSCSTIFSGLPAGSYTLALYCSMSGVNLNATSIIAIGIMR